MFETRIFRAALGVCLLSVLCVTWSRAQDKPDTALQVLKKDHGTFMVINDPLPMVRTVLASDRLQRAMTTGRFGEFITREAGQPVDPKAWLAHVEANQRWVPDEIVVALSDDGMAQTGNIINLVLLGSLENAATGAGEKQAANEMRPELLALLKQTRMPAGLIWVRFRNAEDAKGLFELIVSGVDEITPEYPFVKSTPEAVTMDLGALEFFDRNTLNVLATQMMGLTDANHPDAKAAGEALAKLRVTARLQVLGRGLLLTIGEPSTAPARQSYDARLAGKSNSLMLGEWKAQPLVDGFAVAMKTWDKYRDTKTGAALRAVDSDGLLLDLESNALIVSRSSPAGIFHAETTNDGLEFTSQSLISVRAADVRQSALLKLIPPEAPMYTIDHTQSLADILTMQLTDVESRADLQSLRADFDLNATNLQKQAMVEAYYANMAPFREAILRDMPKLYDDGVVVVADMRGKIDSLMFRDGMERLDFKNLRVPEFAVVGVARDPNAAIENLRAVVDRFATGFFAATGRERAESDTAIEKGDLGLGVPTFVTSRKWIDTLSKGSGVEWRYQGDQQIHFFALDKVIVISTSPRLSKQMIAPRNDVVGLPWTKDKLVARAVFKGEMLSSFAETAGDLIREFAQLNPRRRARAEVEIEALFPAMADLMLYLDRIDAISTDTADTRTGYARIIFRDPPAR